ncbi:MAG: GIY-YIG nuclease family protein [Candidatus Acidiferrales bacterium]
MLYTFAHMGRTYCVYILASRSRILYAGVTNNLEQRVRQHRERLVPGFTSRYRIFRLVHYEMFGDIRLAIAREKEIKGWRREKKLWLICQHNPLWEDLSECLANARAAEKQRIQAAMRPRRQAEDREAENGEAEDRKPDPSPPFAKGARPGSG